MHRCEPRHVRTVDAALGAAWFVAVVAACAIWTMLIGTLLGLV